MKYEDMTVQELRYTYLSSKNPLEREILALYGNYRKLQEQPVDQLRSSWKKADHQQRLLIEKIADSRGLKKKQE